MAYSNTQYDAAPWTPQLDSGNRYGLSAAIEGWHNNSFADEPYISVVKEVESIIKNAPHVSANIYRDEELEFITEDLVSGISELRHSLNTTNIKYAPHEELIAILDQASRMFNVVIIKTPLIMPYTPTFFELDCGYWDATRQNELENRIKSR